MRRWPVRSALYIDFENVPLPPESIANWLAWLEDGEFDVSRRRRRFLQKRVYWNSHAERHRELFERYGFTPILIGKFSGLKNGADIRMAMDVIETTYARFEIDEYLLLTGDSDFVPVLERLREKGKKSGIVATEHRPNIHTTYQLHADCLIPSRRLSAEAPQYKRVRRGLLARLLRPIQTSAQPQAGANGVKPGQNGVRPMPPPTEKPGSKFPAAAPEPRHPESSPMLATALGRVVKLLSQQPRNYMAQKRVLAELDKVPGFHRHGSGAYLGFTTYRMLMSELAALDSRIAIVEQPGGGTGVVFIPPAPTPNLDAQDSRIASIDRTRGPVVQKLVTSRTPELGTATVSTVSLAPPRQQLTVPTGPET